MDTMVDRRIIVPHAMRPIVERAGYAPAVRVDRWVFCAGQIGRTANLEVIEDPEEQFIACWKNLEDVLAAAGCGFHDVVEMTSYHVRMSEHMDLFRTVKNRVFPRGTCAWTRIGVSELAYPWLLAEVKAIAIVPD